MDLPETGLLRRKDVACGRREFDRRSAEVRATAEYREEMERLQLAHAVGQQVKAALEA